MLLKGRADVERFLTRPPADVRAVLVYGPDGGKVREIAERAGAARGVKLDDPFATALLTDSDLDSDGARLADELSALSLTGGARFVRLRLSTDKASVDKAVAEALKTHADGGFNPDCLLVVESGQLAGTSVLRKAAEASKSAAAIPCYEDDTGDVSRMARESLAAEQVSLTTEALETFVARLPKERGVARQEIERLALFIGPGSRRTLGVEELEDFLGVEPEASLFDAASDAFGARLRPAYLGLKRAFDEGETGPAAVRAAGMHLAKLRKSAILVADGKGAKEAAKASGVFWKQEAEFLRQARYWTLDALDQVQPEVLAADRACKTAGSPDALLAERLFLTIAGRARRLGL